MKHPYLAIVSIAVLSSVSLVAESPPPAVAAHNLSFRTLAQTVVKEQPPPVFPKELLELNGKRVRVTGFVMPYDDPEKLDKLLLTGAPPIGCFFCNPPDINAIVFVRRRPKDPPLSFQSDTFTFEGTLRLWSADFKEGDERSQFLFTVDDAVTITKL